MPTIISTFFAYPSHPALIGDTVEHAVANLKEKSGVEVVRGGRLMLQVGLLRIKF
jgi:hypothetical protein